MKIIFQGLCMRKHNHHGEPVTRSTINTIVTTTQGNSTFIRSHNRSREPSSQMCYYQQIHDREEIKDTYISYHPWERVRPRKWDQSVHRPFPAGFDVSVGRTWLG